MVSPFVFIPAIVCVMLMPQFILAWVGEICAVSCGGTDAGRRFLFAPLIDISSYIITAMREAHCNVYFSNSCCRYILVHCYPF